MLKFVKENVLYIFFYLDFKIIHSFIKYTTLMNVVIVYFCFAFYYFTQSKYIGTLLSVDTEYLKKIMYQ